MYILRDLMLILIPSLIVGSTAFLVMKNLLKSEEQRMQQSKDNEKFKLIAPLRLQAYERMIMLLERIAPSQLIMRVIKNGQSAAELQSELVMNIRQEFEQIGRASCRERV